MGRDGVLPPPIRAAAAVLPVAVAAFLANLATSPNIPTWYESLAKPGFTPPNSVFGPVWTVLYAMMAFVAWRILSAPATSTGRGAALAAFWVQLALNATWSFAFFAARSPLAGLVVIGALLAAIVTTIGLFRRIDGLSAWLLVPYAAWVAYAAALNLAIWRLNG